MSTNTEPKLKTKSKTDPATLFIIAATILIFGPFASINQLSGWVLDCAIQIRLGLDTISSGHLITDEIYSWHEGLIFTAHETGWYLILGFIFKHFKLWGVLLICSLFTCGTGITATSHIKKTAHPLICLLVMVSACLFKGFPDYNARPTTTSAFIIMLTTVILLDSKKPVFKASVFVTGAFLLAWLHGGMLPLYYAVMAVFIVIELIYKQFKSAITLACGAAIGFILSIANPIGIRLWTYAFQQSRAKTVWEQIDEWNPVTFTIIQMFLILMVLVGFMCGKDIREFNKEAITKLCLFCMFLIISCVYRRFMVHFTLMYLLVAPKAYQDFILWAVKHFLPKLQNKSINLSGASYYVLVAACLVLFAGFGVLNINRYLPTGTMNDIEKMAAYDGDAIAVVKEKGYQKIFNDFNSGSWLVFNGVKVHIDNRVDPYISQFSDADHMTGKMTVSNLFELDNFRAQYNNDAFLLTTNVGFSPLIYEIETYAPDRYKVVYDNTVNSNMKDGETLRWIVIECLPSAK